MDMQGVAMSVGGQLRYAKTLRLNSAVLEEAKRLGIVIPDIGFWGDLCIKHIHSIREKIPKEKVDLYEDEGKKMRFEAAVEYALDFDKD